MYDVAVELRGADEEADEEVGRYEGIVRGWIDDYGVEEWHEWAGEYMPTIAAGTENVAEAENAEETEKAEAEEKAEEEEEIAEEEIEGAEEKDEEEEKGEEEKEVAWIRVEGEWREKWAEFRRRTMGERNEQEEVWEKKYEGLRESYGERFTENDISREEYKEAVAKLAEEEEEEGRKEEEEWEKRIAEEKKRMEEDEAAEKERYKWKGKGVERAVVAEGGNLGAGRRRGIPLMTAGVRRDNAGVETRKKVSIIDFICIFN
jgi:hypothetical protein